MKDAARLGAIWQVLLGVVIAVGCSSEPTPGRTASAFPRGRAAATGERAVAALAARGSVQCTATLVSSRVLVTAAHCLGGDPRRLSVVFDSPIGRASTEYRVVDARPLPGYDRSSFGGDLALLQIDRKAPVAPLPTAGSAAISSEAILTLVGFGGAPDGDRKRSQGTVRSKGIDEQGSVRLSPAPTSACRGDSGGALLDSHGALVAVLSNGATSCAGEFSATAFDASRLASVKAYLEAVERKSGAGELCWNDDGCTRGHCVFPSDAKERGYCAPPCEASSDCPAPLKCDAASLSCRFAFPSPGALGQPCQKAWDCGDGVCGRAAGSTMDYRCQRPCAGLDLGCPRANRCLEVELVGYAAGARHACQPTMPVAPAAQSPPGIGLIQ
jgi:Trypsin